MILSETSLLMLSIAMVILLLSSAYFSGTETAMMAINRYRLKHLVKKRNRAARISNRLLRKPDRLLGVILIGNNLVNFSAATIATIIGMRLFGDTGVLLAPWILTAIFLIFAEVAPKTLAAERPEEWAFKAVFILEPIQKLLVIPVKLVNVISNALVRPFIKNTPTSSDNLSAEELKTVVNEGANSVGERQSMMVRLLDLEQVSVNDIMIPRNEIEAIDIDSDMSEIVETASNSQHTLLPVYKESINNIIGILHLRRLARFMGTDEFSKSDLMQLTREPYYIPEATPLDKQLIRFQSEKQRIALVLDEYGDLQGLVTLEDILEEIVGEFTSDFSANTPEIHPQEDGSYVIDGGALLRDINRALDWQLPIAGPKTLNGLVLEHLETIPEENLCIQIGEYQIETLQLTDNMVKNLRIVKSHSTTNNAPESDDDELD
jgi:Mg2+/Co2+ transporter CorB